MKELDFAYRIRQALNEGVERLDYKTVLRLEKAREQALARHRVARDNKTVWMPALPKGVDVVPKPVAASWGWLSGLGMVVPLVALFIGVLAIQDWQHDRMLDELADLDFSVLLDEAPIEAYADKAFGVVLGSDETI